MPRRSCRGVGKVEVGRDGQQEPTAHTENSCMPPRFLRIAHWAFHGVIAAPTASSPTFSKHERHRDLLLWSKDNWDSSFWELAWWPMSEGQWPGWGQFR